MATLTPRPPSTATSWKLPARTTASSLPVPSSALPIAASCPLLPHRPIQRLSLCHASLSPQPPPPGGDDDRPSLVEDSRTSLAGLQDRISVFLAVFFWMSLFFWYSAWDGKNNGGSRPNKGGPFRR